MLTPLNMSQQNSYVGWVDSLNARRLPHRRGPMPDQPVTRLGAQADQRPIIQVGGDASSLQSQSAFYLALLLLDITLVLHISHYLLGNLWIERRCTGGQGLDDLIARARTLEPLKSRDRRLDWLQAIGGEQIPCVRCGVQSRALEPRNLIRNQCLARNVAL